MKQSSSNNAWRIEYRQALQLMTLDELQCERHSIAKLVWHVRMEEVTYQLAFNIALPVVLLPLVVRAGSLDPPASPAMHFILFTAVYALSKALQHVTVLPMHNRWQRSVQAAHKTRLMKIDLLIQEYKRRGIRV